MAIQSTVGFATLTVPKGKPRLQRATLLMRHAINRIVGRAALPLLVVAIRPARPPARLLIAPQDIRVADPTRAADIYAGHFALAGRIVNAHGRTPFAIDPPSPAWSEALHGFSWLRHLRAADTALARANGRALVDDWIAMSRGHPPEAWLPAVVSRRLLSWLSQSPVILDGADGRFYRRLMKSLVQQAAFLRRRLAGGLTGDGRLWASLALAETGLCTDKVVSPRRIYAQFLDELDRQVLRDGGHVSRDPQVVIDLLLDLLPLRQAYAARGAEVPPGLLNAIDRMMPLLRMFRHADGSVALFNGMGVSQPEALATILAYDDARAMPLGNAPYTGYQRAASGGSVLICDTGAPPPVAFSARAHAGTLSFEFSTAGHLLVVNCGHPVGEDRAMALAARSTAAHSTLTLDDQSSSRFITGGARNRAGLSGAVVEGPGVVTVQRRSEGRTTVIEASHDGYAARGFIHRRTLALDETGQVLRGEDVLLDSGTKLPEASATPFVLRFHLHPAVRAVVSPEGRSAILTLPKDGAWLFEAGGLELSVEESIYFGSAEGPRRTEQIVVRGEAPALRTVRWSLAAGDGA